MILPLFLFLALIITGKRGPALFFLLALICVYLVPAKGIKKVRRYLLLLFAVLAAVVIIWVFRDTFSRIPLIGRILDSIAGAIEGKDITSGRSRLYAWAIELFKRNPLFGIGWGRFRTTVVGNVTKVYDYEVHNIYLQLLAETGIIGFVAFTATFVTFWMITRTAYSKCVNRNLQGEFVWRKLLFFSLTYQTYFLLYGLSGNPLYDPFFQLMYIFSCMIATAYYGAKDTLKMNM